MKGLISKSLVRKPTRISDMKKLTTPLADLAKQIEDSTAPLRAMFKHMEASIAPFRAMAEQIIPSQKAFKRNWELPNIGPRFEECTVQTHLPNFEEMGRQIRERNEDRIRKIAQEVAQEVAQKIVQEAIKKIKDTASLSSDERYGTYL